MYDSATVAAAEPLQFYREKENNDIMDVMLYSRRENSRTAQSTQHSIIYNMYV